MRAVLLAALLGMQLGCREPAPPRPVPARAPPRVRAPEPETPRQSEPPRKKKPDQRLALAQVLSTTV